MEIAMNSSASATSFPFSVLGNWPSRIAAVAVLTALADWLFFRQHVGLSLALFAVAVGAGVLLANPIEGDRRALLRYTGVLIIAILPSLEDFNVLSALVAILGLGAFALGVAAARNGDLTARFIDVAWFLISAPLHFFRDIRILPQWASEHGVPQVMTVMKGWILPLAFGAIFIILFSAANPLIANLLTQWSFRDGLGVDPQRMAFWFAAVVAIWAFVCARDRLPLPDLGEPLYGPPAPAVSTAIFNDTAIVRSLILFNLLFAIQTVLDIQYLWRGAALPDGMSYATYAHRGAYPLIATALLAAAFVLAAMRPGSNAERSSLMRALVFLWIGQNVLLVASATMRLNLYVETYLLTYWRVAAFIWMLIVAAGLVLIVARIVTHRSNAWLIAANLTIVAVTLYACSFVNFTNLVASYNVARGRDATTPSRPVDVTYLLSLGPQAIPAIDRYLADQPLSLSERSYVPLRRTQLAVEHFGVAANWRTWTFRSWRLSRYLDTSKSTPALTPL
jgi:hypothetical protein